MFVAKVHIHKINLRVLLYDVLIRLSDILLLMPLVTWPSSHSLAYIENVILFYLV